MQLNADPRSVTGKSTRRLRHQGLLPAVVYGQKEAAGVIQLDAHEFDRVFARAGKTQLIDLVVGGAAAHKVLVKEVQRSPRRNTVVHVDFHQVSLREKLQVDVPIVVTGQSELVQAGEADVLQTLQALRVECLPARIPERIEVDVSALDRIDAGIRLSELTLPDGVEAVGDPDELIVKLAARRVAAAVEAEAVGEAEAEAAVPPAEEPPAGED